LSISDVHQRILKKYPRVIHSNTVQVFTPFPKKTKLEGFVKDRYLRDFIVRYERKAREGIYSHQKEFLEAFLNKGKKNFVITTATGSGKSLCFWTWVAKNLLDNKNGTALVCFPTQALMWSQAERLSKMSENKSVTRYAGMPTPWSGSIKVGKESLWWTVWKGTGREGSATQDRTMRLHEQSEAFRTARVRLATIDKAHYSLLQSHENFVRRLVCIVMDEAHLFEGLWGANVHYFLKRLFVATESSSRKRPGVFLSSSTLANARDFAAKLLSTVDLAAICHIDDSVEQKVELIDRQRSGDLLRHCRKDGISKTVLLLDPTQSTTDFEPKEFLADESILGTDVNVICFSESKFESRLLASYLNRIYRKRKVVVYDADLPPVKRREIESSFNSGRMHGITLIATSALELGVDIENLDLCFIGHIPDSRVDYLQRIGRVGRREDRPGLVVTVLSLRPRDRELLRKPEAFHSLKGTEMIGLPLHLEMVRLKHIYAGYREGLYRRYASRKWDEFTSAFTRVFGEMMDFKEVKSTLQSRYSAILDMEDRYWYHKGFRASASEGKIPLTYGSDDVAWIEDINVFRDAHPEAVYLDSSGRRWRIKNYQCNWKIAEWKSPQSQVVLGKFLKILDRIFVEPERRPIATRGKYREEFDFIEVVRQLASDAVLPTKGKVDYGVWEYRKQFDGYREIDLDQNREKAVTLAEITRRFKSAIEGGRDFPFLYPFAYSTLGWEWQFGREYKYKGNLEELTSLFEQILEQFLLGVLETGSGLVARLNISGGSLRIVETTAGGNGLAEALLVKNRFRKAIRDLMDTVTEFKDRPKLFERYVAETCNQITHVRPEELYDFAHFLHDSWTK